MAPRAQARSETPPGGGIPRPRMAQTPGKAQPVQRRSIAAQAAIIEATLTLFAERGYDRTHIDNIIERAGVSSGSFYRYFTSKQELLLLLMDDYLAYLEALGFDQLVITEADAASAVRDALHRAVGAETRYAGLWRAWRDASRSDASLSERRLAVEAWMTATVAKAVERAIAAGVGDGAIAPSTIAFVATSMVWALADVSPARLDDLVAGVAHVLVRAIGHRPTHAGAGA